MSLVSIDAVEMDVSIQCRAAIDTATVNEYAERMSEGDEFPAVVLFGTRSKCWIGDGWHRTLAARQSGAEAIRADLRKGGRVDALRFALGANAVHGQRRTNADKRRCVEIALAEFPSLSSRALAEMCGVGHQLVQRARPRQLDDSSTPAPVTGRDGKAYPARRTQSPKATIDEDVFDALVEADETTRPALGPPCVGMQYAEIAVMNLEQITADDTERGAAFAHVRSWINEHK